MAYTAWAKMREVNRQRYGKDVGPFPPALLSEGEGMDLKSAALRFIHNRCEELKFDPDIEKEEEETGKYQGTSLEIGQIPYNMQMDTNRLCLERALGRFFDSGAAEDAYDVYYCYIEIFFRHYGKPKKMVELLSEFESNGSSLLMKNRDYYSDSVYVFMLGLAIYETDATYRKVFSDFYSDVLGDAVSKENVSEDGEEKIRERLAANLYLEYWGFVALFHDILSRINVDPNQFGYYMDKDVSRRKGPIRMQDHPLDFMLMHCNDMGSDKIRASEADNRKNKHIFLSSSNFLHLFDFAVALHGRRKGEGTPVEELEKNFESISLEYQLSTLNRAKNFSRYLDAINCFYTDKPVDYEMVTEFTPEHAAVFAPMEHERWVRDHISMGWVEGNDYEEVLKAREDLTEKEKKDLAGTLREQMRCHKLTMNGNPTTEEIKVHYDALPEEEKDKDWRPFNSLLKILKKFDGVRIYSYSRD